MDALPNCLYFGKLEHSSGHRLWVGDSGPRNPTPWREEFMDSGILTNAKIKDEVTGNVYWTSAGPISMPQWFAFVWWDRSGDKRPGSNSGLYIRGATLGNATQAFEYACQRWKRVVTRQQFPLILMDPRKGLI
jgi:hypothetical protein